MSEGARVKFVRDSIERCAEERKDFVTSSSVCIYVIERRFIYICRSVSWTFDFLRVSFYNI